uniref:hypothetical protein orf264 n=1 Tax=Deltalsia parasitica TaxID=1424640 RepID=UPI0022FD6624|nr:hypothetical protein orf264 [Deltalsia parasitica]WAX02888.1 hypothetical protein orf264 [Deltalsia parasitica]
MNFLHDISSQDYFNLNFKLSYKKYIYLAQLITLIFLIFLPYIYNINLLILMVLIQLTLLTKFRDLYLIKLLSLYKKVIFFSLNIIFFNYFMNYNDDTTIYISNIFILYFFKIIFLLNIKTFICKLYIYYIVYQIPEYIKQIIILNTLYMIVCCNISIFIKSETINQLIYVGYKYISKLRFKFCNRMTINILISSQILEKIIDRINSIYLGIRMKNQGNKKEIIKYIIFGNNKLCDQIIKDQNDLNITLWNKSIHNKFKNKMYID